VDKPPNRFARIIWGLLGAYVIISVVQFVVYELYREELPRNMLLSIVLNAIYATVLFGGAATVIELVDQIRWNALPPDQRNPR
jgi:ABC-type transporter Mla maintaining outer membrane lipid asymmetry permease subunit MlaE